MECALWAGTHEGLNPLTQPELLALFPGKKTIDHLNPCHNTAMFLGSHQHSVLRSLSITELPFAPQELSQIQAALWHTVKAGYRMLNTEKFLLSTATILHASEKAIMLTSKPWCEPDINSAFKNSI